MIRVVMLLIVLALVFALMRWFLRTPAQEVAKIIKKKWLDHSGRDFYCIDIIRQIKLANRIGRCGYGGDQSNAAHSITLCPPITAVMAVVLPSKTSDAITTKTEYAKWQDESGAGV